MHRVLIRLLAALALLILFPSGAFCEELNADQIAAVKRIQNKLAVVKDLSEHELITPEQTDKANSFYLLQATQVTGRQNSVPEVDALVTNAAKTEGFGAFLNTIIVMAGIFLLLSAVSLITYYLRNLLRLLPSSFYECAAYVSMAILLAAGYLFRPFEIWFLKIDPLWLVVPGSFAFGACVYLSYWLHWLRPRGRRDQADRGTARSEQGKEDQVYLGPGLITFPTVLFGLCTLAWGLTAVFFHQLFPSAGIPHFIAFITTMALQSFLGFSMITTPGCIALGWNTEEKVAKSTVSSLILLLAYIGIKFSGVVLPECIKLFETGCLFMGAFVYYLGLLVMSSKLYCQSTSRGAKTDHTWRSRYVLMQITTIVSGLVAFYLGNNCQLGSLLGIGGTFFTIYLLEKYYEIPWKGVGWAWSLLGVAIAFYFFVGFAGQHPSYFVWGIR